MSAKAALSHQIDQPDEVIVINDHSSDSKFLQRLLAQHEQRGGLLSV